MFSVYMVLSEKWNQFHSKVQLPKNKTTDNMGTIKKFQ